MSNQKARWFAALAAFFTTSLLVAAPFEPLFRVINQKGPCQVRLPGDTAFTAAQKGKAYPYGTTVECGSGGGATIILSARDAIVMAAGATVEIAAADGDAGQKLARLRKGGIETRMDAQNPPRALVVETPVAICTTLAGNAKLKFSEDESGMSFEVQPGSGSSLNVVGPQFAIPGLKNGYGARIFTVRDNSLTRIENLLGDYTVMINKGESDALPDVFEEGVVNDDLLRIETSTRATVKIWRARAPVGGRLIVSVLATDSSGRGRETFAFAVGQPSIGSRAIFEEAADTNAPAMAPEDKGASGKETPDTPSESAAPAAEEAPEPLFQF